MSKRGKRYKSFKDNIKVDTYSINDAVKVLKDGKAVKFDETLEANTDFDFSGEGPKFEEVAKELLDKKIIPPAYKQ